MCCSTGLASSACSSHVNLHGGGSGGSGGYGTGTGLTTTTTTGTGGGGAGPGEPPAPGPVHPGDGSGVVLAVTKLFLGDTNPDGSPNASAGWKHFGLNLDHRVSTPTSVDLCKPAAGASPQNVYPDGDDGIDNSWGKNILPVFLGVAPDMSAKVNQALASGGFTLLIDIEALGASSDYNPLLSKVYRGAALGAPPKLDGTDAWPVMAEDLSNPADIASAKLTLPTSYVTAGTWVSGPPAASTLHVTMDMTGYLFDFAIEHAIVTMDLSPDHASASMGTIAGVLDTEVFVAEMKQVAGSFDPSLCSGSTIDSIANQLRQASDIMSDGSQDPSATCNGISIGLGFEAKLVKLGPIAPPALPAPSPCP